MNKEIPTRFDHSQEPAIYAAWEKAGYFKPSEAKEPFVMVMPPPNVTGDLHLGHALTYAVHDTIARFWRRQGRAVLLLPGADHAAIAVQALVEKKVQKEKGLSRTQLGKDKFLVEVGQWIDHYLPRMKTSLKRFGLSCDWSRFRFTMDDHSQHAVQTAFIELYQQGLIYRGEYLINWDPKLQTAISDDEVMYQETAGKLYWLKYGPITVATTRPETKLGDTAIAVHPNDKRYQELVGTTISFKNETGKTQKLPVIADEAVDPEFGTGALKVTPAHDQVDWELRQRHPEIGLKPVIDRYGKMAADCGSYAGLKATEAREKIVKDLDDQGLIEKITEYKIRQPISERSGAVVEPLPSTQWFLKTTALKDKAVEAVKTGQIKFYPKNIEKVYFHWLENLHDWCISRQLWWGHPIPSWYDQDGKIYVAESLAAAQKQAGSKAKLTAEEDVLDTWFSSGLWPFSTLGWPNAGAPDLKHFFPTDLLETGADILFFWVARMIMLSQALTKEIPFRQVYFHGLILDETGQKMSKSKGNVLDPLQLIDKYGADALRMSLIGGNSAGQNQRYSEQKILKYRNFVTKIWNASRFVALTVGDTKPELPKELDQTEKKFVEGLTKLEAQNLKFITSLQLGLALEELYEFFWHRFSDQLIEYEKTIIQEAAESKRVETAKQLLGYSLERLLKLTADFAPFVASSIQETMLHD